MRDNKECCPYCNALFARRTYSERIAESIWFAHFTRKIGISSIEADRIIKWKCPDCNKERDRD